MRRDRTFVLLGSYESLTSLFHYFDNYATSVAFEQSRQHLFAKARVSKAGSR
jgi:hypothetical protein